VLKRSCGRKEGGVDFTIIRVREEFLEEGKNAKVCRSSSREKKKERGCGRSLNFSDEKRKEGKEGRVSSRSPIRGPKERKKMTSGNFVYLRGRTYLREKGEKVLDGRRAAGRRSGGGKKGRGPSLAIAIRKGRGRDKSQEKMRIGVGE